MKLPGICIAFTSSKGVRPTVNNWCCRPNTHGRYRTYARCSKLKAYICVRNNRCATDFSADEFEFYSAITALVLESYLMFSTILSGSKIFIYLFDPQLPRVARSRERVASGVVVPPYRVAVPSGSEQRGVPRTEQPGYESDQASEMSLHTRSPLTCCLFPRFVTSVNTIFCDWSVSSSAFSSSTSARRLRAAGGKTELSHMASAVFLSTLRDSAEVSVVIFASSRANSLSSSSEGPRNS